MNKTTKIIVFSIPALLFALLIMIFAKELGKPKNEALPSAMVSKSIPNFSLPSLLQNGVMISQQDWKGKLMLVNFWATWCAVCYDEHRFLQQIQQKYGLPLYGVNYKNEQDESIPWLNRNGNPFVSIVYDIEGGLGLDMGLTGTPETFLIDQNGIIRAHHPGEMNDQVWLSKFQPVIDQIRAN